jgi:hypothetical protein
MLTADNLEHCARTAPLCHLVIAQLVTRVESGCLRSMLYRQPGDGRFPMTLRLHGSKAYDWGDCRRT